MKGLNQASSPSDRTTLKTLLPVKNKRTNASSSKKNKSQQLISTTDKKNPSIKSQFGSKKTSDTGGSGARKKVVKEKN